VFGKRFGDHAYAIEELTAELGAAFICADLGIGAGPREDHACYINNWLSAMKADANVVFAAASAAGKAVEFLRISE
jgi:antirestriction protein ArdC